ncbi:MAG: hypothetical protein ACIAS6_13695 [Phycisphaerales bacterium JB060]
MPKRQIVIVSSDPADEGLPPLGTIDEVSKALADFNTAPDGSERSASAGTVVLHGPGLVVELPMGLDRVTQGLVTLIDEDVAWPVLMRLVKNLPWKLLDLETGRSFG